MSNFSVKTTDQLKYALTQAKSGDTITVASGTYSNVTLTNINIAGNVTIVSADPARPAVFTDMMLKNSSGLTFRGLEFDATSAKMYAFTVFGSSNIVLDDLNVHGSLNGNPGDDISPLMIRNSSNVTVSNSEFHEAWHALSFLDNTGLTITNNSFHDIRTDAVRGGGTSNMVISGNYFTDFYPDWGTGDGTGDHPDAIQLWTSGTTKAASNITITDNVVTRGAGDPVQGIFIRDQLDTLPFQNVTVTGNTIVGGIGNGIGIDGVNGLTVSNNNVIAIEGQKSNIRIERVTSATVSENEASGYIYIDSPTVKKVANVLAETITVDMGRMISASIAGMAGSRTAEADVGARINAAFESSISTLDGSAIAPSTGTTATVATMTLSVFADDVIARMVTSLGYIDPPIEEARVFTEQVVQGTAGNDRLSATTIGNSRLEGGAGDDMLIGVIQGSHTMVGGAGDDNYVVRAAGNAVVEGLNGGNDTVTNYISYTLGANVENLRMGAGGLTGTGNGLDNRMVGSTGKDILYGLAGNDTLQGGDGDDRLFGGEGNDLLRGDAGNDWLDGGNGNDNLLGGDGNDTLAGGAGADVLEGGAGQDTMTGGIGADIFRFRSADVAAGGFDVITDFARGTDKIDLSPIDARIATTTNDAFAFIGTAAFTKKAGELRFDKVGVDSFVYGDVNGDGIADFSIVLKGVGALAASDFTL
ncbi:hypothetical protein ASG29_15585 [Sphingomonas sp. Leaf412]|uniref:right-handed parallel beta-helix repeat-containing protein n=1 Tax=Sphingomonas sp. Leaf412 TaxID=1736370 RepID=UPI0006F84D86|nr:right-handed parallel beta-helix repeat-containing protein [Sphingomonas sp. Leaf412]KQT31365.1 hypothetical protein ASG29_15585 [Sphingomonas sp. Leaf412]